MRPRNFCFCPINCKKIDLRQVGHSSIFVVLSTLILIYTGSLYKRVRVAACILMSLLTALVLTVAGGDVYKLTEKSKNVLQLLWAQECHTEFDYGDKLGFMHVSKTQAWKPRQEANKSTPESLFLPVSGLGKRLRSDWSWWVWQLTVGLSLLNTQESVF